jgi:AcrR family transcriptional regulator
VAERRSDQRSALLNAAGELLLDNDPDAVSPDARGHAVGPARVGVYEYFGPGRDILAGFVETSFNDWTGEIRGVVATEHVPSARIDAYARATVELDAAGRHRVAGTVAAARLAEPCRDRIGELHRRLREPLLAALRQRADSRAEITAALVQGALDGAIGLIDAGTPPGEVFAETTEFLRPCDTASTG